MPENLAGMIRTDRYSVNATGPAGTNMELGHLPPPFYRGHPQSGNPPIERVDVAPS